MPADLNKLNDTKQRIITFMSVHGPSLPVHLAREISASPIFAAAFLSELYAEGRIKISNMRVGSSPLYFLPGQEPLLENFINYLNQKEKEALSLLKNYKILEDEKQEPAVRVALRSVKDFAIPLKIQFNNEPKIIWKYFLFPDEEIRSLVNEKLNPSPKPQSQPLLKKELPSINEQEITKPQEPSQINQNAEPPQSIQKEKAKRKAKPKADPKFPKAVKEYLTSKNIEILSIIEEKSKEFTAKVRTDNLFGKQEYYLIAKDKKKISDVDLTLAHHQAQQEKMIALILAPGELDKKAQEYHQHWKNLIKFEKAKL
jgi:hypothetical protein